MLTLTTREAVALVGYYVHGLSHRRLAEGLKCSHTTVQRALRSGTRAVLAAAADHGPEAVVADLAHTFDGPVSWRAEQRQSDLWLRVEEHVEHRQHVLDTINRVMGADDEGHALHRQRHDFDRWELDLLAQSHRSTLSAADYEARRLERFVVTS